MRKHIFLLSLVLMLAGASVTGVQAAAKNDLNTAISMYKAGNYSGSIQYLEPLLSKDPSNAVAHYYMALANVQAGRVEEAINHYDSVIQLNTQETLVRYATRGKLCLEDAEQCAANSTLDDFIRNTRGFDLTNSVKSNIETQRLESIRRDINDNKEIPKERLNQYKRFTSSAETAPSNDEIVAALRTLQRAGLNTPVMPYAQDLSAIYASSAPSGNYDSMANLMNLLSGGNNAKNSNGIDPKVLQTIMTSQMMGL